MTSMRKTLKKGFLMAVNRRTPQRGYGLNNPTIELAPNPIIATRAPGNNDIAELGTQWINKSTNVPYVLTSVVNGVANWATAPASGATTLASLTVTTTSDLQGAVTMGSTLDVTGATTVTDLSISGSFNLSGSNPIDLTTSANLADAIVLEATAGGIDILASGAAAGEDIDIIATGSSVNISSSEAAADSITLQSASGGIDVDGALQVNIASSQNAGDAIRLNASAGGIDIDAAGAAGEDITIDNAAGSIALTAGESAADSIVIESTAGGIDILASGAAAGEDIDIVATGSSVHISSSESANDAITLTATAGGIDILATGAAAGEDIDIAATGSSVNISASENVADAITLNASAGGIDITAAGAAAEDIDITCTAGSVNITGGEAAVANAVRINASAADGGIDVDAGTGGITIDSTGALSLDAAAASNFSVSGAGIDLTLASSAGRVVVDGGEAAADAVRITASDAAGGVDIDSGTGGITVDSTDAISLDAAAASNFSVSGAGIDLTLASSGGRVVVNGEEAAADAVRILSAAGGLDADVALQMNLTSSQAAAADSIRVNASAADGGIDVDAGTGGITIDSTGPVSIDGAAASNMSVSGAGIDLTLASSGGRVVVNGEEAAADAVRILSAAGGLDADVALQMNLVSSQAAAADSVRIQASAADGGIDVDAGTGGLTLDSTGAISIDGAAASNMSVSGAGIDLTLASSAGRVVLDGGEAAADAVTITASDAAGGIDMNCGTGGMTLDTTAGFSLDAATASNVTVTGASADLTLAATGGSVNITATEAAADAIVINASDAAGGIDLLTGGGELTINAVGNVSMAPVSATVSSPTSTAVTNGRVFKAVYQGFTTAAAGTQAYTITNSALGAGDAIMLTLANRGSNDAQITVNRVNTETAGTIIVNTTNEGAAALNGDVVITGWILD